MLEPFIRRVMMEQTIKGFQVANREFKIAAYADDLLFFLTQPLTSIPQLLTKFSLYGYVSNMKINYTKSEALNVSVPTAILRDAQANSTFKWESLALKYLGIWLTPHLSQIFEKNFPPLLKTIEADLAAWRPKHFSWFGRAAICKMSILPRLL